MQISTAALLALVAVSPVVAQWSCGGTQYEPGSVTFSPQCEQLVTNCVKKFADVTVGDCQDAASLINMQQQPSSGNNNDVATAFTDIVNHCINNGYTTATWYRDSQWYWMATGSTCYNFTMPSIPADLTTPVQQRLSIQGKNAIAVGWNTYTKLSSICVQYGLSAQDLQWQECAASSVTYPTSRTWTNVVTLGNLQSGTTYYYKIVSTNSTVGQFLSPRNAGDDTPFSFAAVIDMGVYGADGLAPPSSKTRKDTIPNIQPDLNHTTIWQLAQSINDYEFVVHPGDFAYADNFAQVFSLNSDPVEAYQTILEQFWEQLAPITSRKPYMVGPGNHDADCTESNFNAETSCPVGQYNFTDFTVRFGQMMPTTFATESTQVSAQSQSQKAQLLAKAPFWYSFDYGMVHVTIIDTETDFANAPDGPGGSNNLDAGPFGFNNQQLEFVAADLASVDRTITPWVIVAGHRAWYSTGGSGNICLPCQAAFEKLLYTYGVDLAIFGHVHNSQRFMPVFNGTADPNGMNDPKAPMYIVAGGAGNLEGLASVGSNLSFNAFAYANDFSFATVSIKDRNHLQVDFIQSSTGNVLDSSILYKSHNQQFVVQGQNSTVTSTSTSSSSSSSSSTAGISTSTGISSSNSSSIFSSSSTVSIPRPTTSSFGPSTTSVVASVSQTSSSISNTFSSSNGTFSSGTTTQISSFTSTLSNQASTGTPSPGSSSSSFTLSTTGTPTSFSSTCRVTSLSTRATTTVTSTTPIIISNSTITIATTASLNASSICTILSISTSKMLSSSFTSMAGAGSSLVTLSSTAAPISQSSSSGTTSSTSLVASSAPSSSSSSSVSVSIGTARSSYSSSSSATPKTAPSSVSIVSSTETVPYTSSTVYTTVTSTISTCASTVVNCPYTTKPITVTDTVIDYVTYCPVGSLQTTAPAAAGPSTIYTTVISTISSCASTVINCPYSTAAITVTNIVVASVIPAPNVSISKTNIASVVNATAPASTYTVTPASKNSVATASGSIIASTTKPAVAINAAGRLNISFISVLAVIILTSFIL